MRNLLSTITFFVLSLCVGVSQPSTVSVIPASLDAGVAHRIDFESKTDDVSCSSIAVGEHTLLTAAHCVLGTSKLVVDGKDTNIISQIYDEQDHVLLVLDMSFAYYLPIEQREFTKGEHIRMWGWPGNSEDAVYREGYFKYVDGELYIWQLPIYPGDSGSGMISDDNKVIGIVSLGNKSAECAIFLLSFSSDQLKKIS